MYTDLNWEAENGNPGLSAENRAMGSVLAAYLAVLVSCVVIAMIYIYRRRGAHAPARVWILIGLASALGIITLIVMQTPWGAQYKP
jgi:hypothetical protein